MDNLARHMRISSVTVSDNDVESRKAAAKALATTWAKDNKASNIISTAAAIAEALGGNGIPSSELGEKVQVNIQNKAPSFLYEERPLDVGICAGMAMVSILSGEVAHNGWTTQNIYAVSLWSAISYQPILQDERRENLRQEILEKTFNFYSASVEKTRERINVPDPDDLNIAINEQNEASSDFQKVMAGTIDALRCNAALDREELDFLWWVQLGRSRLLQTQLSNIAEPLRIVAAGIEAAQILRRFPCEVHREIVLRTLEENSELDLDELLAIIGDDRTKLCSNIVKTHVFSHPTVFPLLHALLTGEVDKINPSSKRSVSEWGERALLEATFIKMISTGAGTV